MNVTFGMKAHSGWAALVVLGKGDGDVAVVDWRRIDLVEDEWAKQPYHAAEDLKADAARDLVKRGVEAAHRNAVREMRAAVKREGERDNEVTACAAAWSVLRFPSPRSSLSRKCLQDLRRPTDHS